MIDYLKDIQQYQDVIDSCTKRPEFKKVDVVKLPDSFIVQMLLATMEEAEEVFSNITLQNGKAFAVLDRMSVVIEVVKGTNKINLVNLDKEKTMDFEIGHWVCVEAVNDVYYKKSGTVIGRREGVRVGPLYSVLYNDGDIEEDVVESRMESE